MVGFRLLEGQRWHFREVDKHEQRCRREVSVLYADRDDSAGLTRAAGNGA